MRDPTLFLDGRVALHAGDCREVLRGISDASIDSCVTDPPYALVSIGKRFGADDAAPCKPGKTGAYQRASAGFMGKSWDTGETAFAVEFWQEMLRVLKPGAHVAAFGGTRSYHRLACAIEDAGFEIRDQIGWAYGSGFPKSHDVSKGIDKAAGLEREIIRERYTAKRIKPGGTVVREGAYGKQDISFTATDTAPASEDAAAWQGWGTALKPAWEPIVLARKPLISTVAANVLRHGTGALNIDGCRISTDDGYTENAVTQGVNTARTSFEPRRDRRTFAPAPLGRWPANLVHDGSPEVLAAFPDNLSSGTGAIKRSTGEGYQANAYGKESRSVGTPNVEYGDSGSAARFFYTAKADADDRLGSRHPTVKPVDIMQWLVRLITPPGGVVLDPFAGTGTTGEAAFREGFRAILIERETEYQTDIARRMALCLAGPDERARESMKASGRAEMSAGPLFGDAA